MAKAKPIDRSKGIQVLGTKECPEITDAEMEVSGYIRPVADPNTILEKKILLSAIQPSFLYFIHGYVLNMLSVTVLISSGSSIMKTQALTIFPILLITRIIIISI